MKSLTESAAYRPGVVKLAWRNATRDRRRLLQAASGIGFAATLIFMQLGFRDGFLESAMLLFRALDGDLFVVSAVKYPPSRGEPFPRRRLYQAASYPGIVSASPIYMVSDQANLINPAHGSSHTIRVIAIDPDKPVLRLPEVEANLVALREPNTVLMDSRARSLVGPFARGTETVLTNRRIRVVATFPMGPNFAIDGTLIMSDRNFSQFFPSSTDGVSALDQVEFGVLKAAPDADVAALKAGLSSRLPPDVVVLTREEMIASEEAYQLADTPVGPIFALGTAIGFIVGMIIAYQILFTDIADRRPQYATLRAMGFRARYMLGVVLRQSAYYGLAGFIPAMAASFGLFHFVNEVIVIPMEMTLGVIGLTFAMTVGMCLLAGLFAARGVFAADPAELF